MERNNTHEQEFESNEATAVVASYKDEFEDRLYFHAARMKFIVSYAASFVANFISVITALTFLSVNFMALMPEFVPVIGKIALSVAVSVFLLAMFEAVKRENTSNFFKHFYKTKRAGLAKIAAGVVFIALSVAVSLLGASDLARLSIDKASAIHESFSSKENEIMNKSALKIDALEVQALELENQVHQLIRQKKLLTFPQSVVLQINGKREEQRQLRADAEKELNKLKAEKLKQSSENEAQTGKTVWFMLALSLFAEILSVLGVWFVVYYKYKSILQFENLAKEPQKEDIKPKEIAKFVPQEAQLNFKITEPPSFSQPVVAEFRKEKACLTCKNKFKAKTYHHKFCSTHCKTTYHNQKQS